MEPRDIYITDYDLTRLKELLQVSISFAERDGQSLEALQGELDRAHIVSRQRFPTMS
jgi:regulator of nucleoside diphosphate kinase